MTKKIMSSVILAVLIAAFSLSAYAYENPIPFYDRYGNEAAMGDPFVMKYNGVYYCYTSGGICYTSYDMVNWSCEGKVFEGAHSNYLFAPEVFYWNGVFYCISCPDGTTNYLFKSSSPKGPFTVSGGELGGDIDGSFFRDDDGSLRFVHAGWQGIAMYKMDTPESPLANSRMLPQSISGMWTEGPGIFKRGSKYYMTFTGNHVLDYSYRVEYAVSDHLDNGWYEPQQNILLLSTGGKIMSLGHNSVVIGPDLDSYYIVYHNRYPDGTKNIDRGFNMQKILWNGDKPTVIVSTEETENPKLPIYEYRPDNGTEKLSGKILSDIAAEKIFTAEFNTIPSGTDILFGYRDDGNHCRLTFDGKYAILEKVKNSKTETIKKELPQNTSTDVMQCIRIQQTEEILSIYLAGGLLISAEPFSEGRIGCEAENGTVGYMAFSNKAMGNLDYTDEKFTKAVYDAVFADNINELSVVASKEDGNAVILKEGEAARFTLKSDSKSNLTFTLRGYAKTDAVIDIYINGETAAAGMIFGASERYRTEVLRSVTLNRGDSEIEIRVVKGEFELYQIGTASEVAVKAGVYDMERNAPSIIAQEGDSEFKDGKLILTAAESPKGDCFAKNIIGNAGWSDYSAEVKFTIPKSEKDAEAGIYIRSANASDTEASAFRFRRKWYQQCYFACAADGAIRLYKQNYDEQLLAEFKTDADFSKEHILKIAAVGDLITVYLDGVQIISYTDTDHPFMNGKAGLKVVNCTAYYDDLTIEPLEAATSFEAPAEPFPETEEKIPSDSESSFPIIIAYIVLPPLIAVAVVTFKRLVLYRKHE